MSDGVKALVFDVFGTVVDWRSSIIADLEAFGRAKNLKAEHKFDYVATSFVDLAQQTGA